MALFVSGGVTMTDIDFVSIEVYSRLAINGGVSTSDERSRLGMTPMHANLFAVVAAFLGLVPLESAPQPKELSVKGTYVHPATGREFPELVGEFRRWRVTQYGPDDISVGYNLESRVRRVAATVYVYPGAKTPFSEELGAIKEGHSSFKLTFEQDVVLEKGPNRLECRLAGVSYNERFANRDGTVGSYLLVCDEPPWRVKWRVTYLPMSDPEIVEVVRTLAASVTVRD